MGRASEHEFEENLGINRERNNTAGEKEREEGAREKQRKRKILKMNCAYIHSTHKDTRMMKNPDKKM